MNIIGVAGVRGSGKGTAAAILVKDYGFKELAFAHTLKCAVSQTYDLPYRTFHSAENKDVPYKEPLTVDIWRLARFCNFLEKYQRITDDQFENMLDSLEGNLFRTPRDVLKFFGTDLIRKYVDNDFWCMTFRKDCESYEKVVVADVRFPNERALVVSLGGHMIRVDRPNESEEDSHISENSYGRDSEYVKVFNNNTTVEDLHKNISMWYDNQESLKKIGI